MKSALTIFFAILITSLSFSQDLNELLGLFNKSSLPYEFPLEATIGFGDEEEEESPYQVIDVEVFNAIIGAGVNEESILEAIDVITFDKFYILVLAETSMDINDGMISRDLVYFTIDKTGAMIDMRYAQTTDMYDSFDEFSTVDTDAMMAMSDYEGEENLVIVEKTKTVTRMSMEGMHNESQTIITTTYESIATDGKISDVTSYLKN